MLLVHSKLTGNFPVDRFVVTLCVSFICMVFLVSVAFIHQPKHLEEVYSLEEQDYDFNIDVEIFPLSEARQTFNELTEDQMKTMDTRMTDRRNHIKNICLKISENITNKEVNAHEFFIDKNRHLIWCNIFKAASTTWLHNFNTLGQNYANKYDSLSLTPFLKARQRYPRPSVTQLLDARADDDSVGFVIVRHPFERLSSAYRDKIQSSPPMGMYADLAEEIIMHYRKKVSKSEEGFLYPVWPSFEEFVRYVLDQSKSEEVMDIHWAPYTPFCTPCHFDFDIIIKFETLEDDQKYLIQKAGIGDIIRPQWKNAGYEKRVNNGKNTTELVAEHYSQLTNQQISQLYEFYKYDFLVFNYTVEDYYTISKDSNTSTDHILKHIP